MSCIEDGKIKFTKMEDEYAVEATEFIKRRIGNATKLAKTCVGVDVSISDVISNEPLVEWMNVYVSRTLLDDEKIAEKILRAIDEFSELKSIPSSIVKVLPVEL